MAPHAEPSPQERIAALGFSEADTATLTSHFLDAESRGKLGHGLSRIDWLETLPDLEPDARPRRLHAEPGYERWEGNGALGYLTLAAIVDAQLAAAAFPRPRRRGGELLSDRDARLVCPPARGGRARRGADGDLARAARSPGRRRAAGGDEPARDRDPQLGRRTARRRRLDGRGHLRRRAARRRSAGRARALRRRAGAQGVRACARAGAPRRRARGRGLRRRARRRPPRGRSRSRSCGAAPRVYGSPATRSCARSSSSSAHFFSAGSSSSARSSYARASSSRPALALMQARW